MDHVDVRIGRHPSAFWATCPVTDCRLSSTPVPGASFIDRAWAVVRLPGGIPVGARWWVRSRNLVILGVLGSLALVLDCATRNVGRMIFHPSPTRWSSREQSPARTSQGGRSNFLREAGTPPSRLEPTGEHCPRQAYYSRYRSALDHRGDSVELDSLITPLQNEPRRPVARARELNVRANWRSWVRG